MSFVAFKVNLIHHTFFKMLCISKDTLVAHSSTSIAKLVSEKDLDETLRFISTVFKFDLNISASYLIASNQKLGDVFKDICSTVCLRDCHDPHELSLMRDIRKTVDISSHVLHSPSKEYGETISLAVKDALNCAAKFDVVIDVSRFRHCMLRVEKRIHLVENFTSYIRHLITNEILVALIFNKLSKDV